MIQNLIRPNVLAMKPYSSARSEFSGEAGIFLDANENAFGSPVEIPGFENISRYPDPRQNLLREKIADLFRLEKENLFLGVGSDEAIDLLIRIFCEPGKDSILITPPTYGLYKVAAQFNDVQVKEVLLNREFQMNSDEILKAGDMSTKVIFLCSPNNPTGNTMNKEEMKRICQEFKGIVVVDEAYIDFAEPELSMLDQLEEFQNLVVLRTFSKGWGLAGIRLGMAFANPELIEVMMKVKPPYNVNTLTIQTALLALEKKELVTERINTIRSERQRLSDALKKIPGVLQIFSSEANFILFRVRSAQEIYKQLREKGIVIRFRGVDPLCEDCVRVTIGTPKQNNRFLQILTSLL